MQFLFWKASNPTDSSYREFRGHFFAIMMLSLALSLLYKIQMPAPILALIRTLPSKRINLALDQQDNNIMLLCC